MIRLLIKFWPALIPILIFVILIIIFRKKKSNKKIINGEYVIDGKENLVSKKNKNFSFDNPYFVYMIYATIIMFLLSIFLIIYNQDRKTLRNISAQDYNHAIEND